MRTPIMAANWKMNKTNAEGLAFLDYLRGKQVSSKMELMIFAPHVMLSDLVRASEPEWTIGAQNFYYEDKGAYTGEVSAPMLKAIGVSHVLIGHSERRMIFKESEEMLHEKLVKALKEEMVPVFCVGESLEERKNGAHFSKVTQQLNSALEGIEAEKIRKMVIAYEPIWAIGTGETATAGDAEEMCAHIRKHMERLFGSIAEELRILYGGSVKPSNVKEILGCPNIDGALVGGASLQADDFIALATGGNDV